MKVNKFFFVEEGGFRYTDLFGKNPSTTKISIREGEEEGAQCFLEDLVLEPILSERTVNFKDITWFVNKEAELLASIWKNEGKIYSLNIYHPMEFKKGVEFSDKIKSKRLLSEKPEISIIKKEKEEYSSLSFQIDFFDLDLETHYPKEVCDFHKDVEAWISEKSLNNRLVLISGEAGTGKTNYIKFLMTKVAKNREVFYISPSNLKEVLDANLITFLSGFKNSVLIIEDAEEALLERGKRDPLTNLLLNMSDGILASIMDFKIICTFNVEENQIDKALLRKGRLFRKCKFGKLDEVKTHNLYKKLYGENPPVKEMSLAEIYERNDNGNAKESKVIGFS